jgi:hypothetical protein
VELVLDDPGTSPHGRVPQSDLLRRRGEFSPLGQLEAQVLLEELPYDLKKLCKHGRDVSDYRQSWQITIRRAESYYVQIHAPIIGYDNFKQKSRGPKIQAIPARPAQADFHIPGKSWTVEGTNEITQRLRGFILDSAIWRIPEGLEADFQAFLTEVSRTLTFFAYAGEMREGHGIVNPEDIAAEGLLKAQRVYYEGIVDGKQTLSRIQLKNSAVTAMRNFLCSQLRYWSGTRGRVDMARSDLDGRGEKVINSAPRLYM